MKAEAHGVDDTIRETIERGEPDAGAQVILDQVREMPELNGTARA